VSPFLYIDMIASVPVALGFMARAGFNSSQISDDLGGAGLNL
jgi:hypothetical protein